MDNLGRGHRAFISTHLVPLFSFNLTLSTSLFSSLFVILLLTHAQLFRLKNNRNKIPFLTSCGNALLSLQGDLEGLVTTHCSTTTNYSLPPPSTETNLWFPVLSFWLYLMGSHYASLPRHFWGVHLCQPLCSLESYTTTIAGFLPTSLGTPLLAPLKEDSPI